MRVRCRFEPVPEEEGRAIPRCVALDFGNQRLLRLQVEQNFGGLAPRQDAARS